MNRYVGPPPSLAARKSLMSVREIQARLEALRLSQWRESGAETQRIPLAALADFVGCDDSLLHTQDRAWRRSHVRTLTDRVEVCDHTMNARSQSFPPFPAWTWHVPEFFNIGVACTDAPASCAFVAMAAWKRNWWPLPMLSASFSASFRPRATAMRKTGGHR